VGLAWLLRANFAEGSGFIPSLWALVVLVTAGIGAYFVAAQLSGAFRISELKAAMKR
jgi:hypothetical protein